MTTTLERYRADVRSDLWDESALVAAMAENIMHQRAQADEDTETIGAEWYREGRELAHAVGSGDDVLGGAVLAVLSPRRQWRENVALGLAWSQGLPVRTMSDQVRKLERIANGEDLNTVVSGPKVRSFWANLAGDSNAVTVDVWALRAALGSDKVTDPDYGKLVNGRRYELVAQAYRRVARFYGEAPSTTQAIVWIITRGSAE